MANTTELTLSTIRQQNTNNTVMNLNTPITDGSSNSYTIVGLSNSTSLFKKRNSTSYISVLTLPKTLRSIPKYAMDVTSNMDIYLPEDNEVTSIGEGAFSSGSGLKGNIVLTNCTSF